MHLFTFALLFPFIQYKIIYNVNFSYKFMLVNVQVFDFMSYIKNESTKLINICQIYFNDN